MNKCSSIISQTRDYTNSIKYKVFSYTNYFSQCWELEALFYVLLEVIAVM